MTDEKEKLMRVMIWGLLVSHSGKQLIPDVVGQITEEIMTQILEVINRQDEYK